jgi:hypothetical protein
MDERRSDATPAVLWEYACRDEATPRRIGRAADSAPGQLSVRVGQEEQPAHLGAQLLDRRSALSAEHALLDLPPRLEVGVGLGSPELDHPDLFSFPCFFA